jgi:hypothetical protein
VADEFAADVVNIIDDIAIAKTAIVQIAKSLVFFFMILPKKMVFTNNPNPEFE